MTNPIEARRAWRDQLAAEIVGVIEQRVRCASPVRYDSLVLVALADVVSGVLCLERSDSARRKLAAAFYARIVRDLDDAPDAPRPG